MSKLEHIEKLIEYMLGNSVNIYKIYAFEDSMGGIKVSMIFEKKYRSDEFVREFDAEFTSHDIAGSFVNDFMEVMEFEELVSKEREKYK